MATGSEDYCHYLKEAKAAWKRENANKKAKFIEEHMIMEKKKDEKARRDQFLFDNCKFLKGVVTLQRLIDVLKPNQEGSITFDKLFGETTSEERFHISQKFILHEQFFWGGGVFIIEDNPNEICYTQYGPDY